MESSQRIVKQLPLEEIWNAQGNLVCVKIRELNINDLAVILRSSDVYFIIADVGEPLRWVPTDECYAFWKAEIKHRMIESWAEKIHLEDFPSGYCYLASEWKTTLEKPVVVLEKFH